MSAASWPNCSRCPCEPCTRPALAASFRRVLAASLRPAHAAGAILRSAPIALRPRAYAAVRPRTARHAGALGRYRPSALMIEDHQQDLSRPPRRPAFSEAASAGRSYASDHPTLEKRQWGGVRVSLLCRVARWVLCDRKRSRAQGLRRRRGVAIAQRPSEIWQRTGNAAEAKQHAIEDVAWARLGHWGEWWVL